MCKPIEYSVSVNIQYMLFHFYSIKKAENAAMLTFIHSEVLLSKCYISNTIKNSILQYEVSKVKGCIHNIILFSAVFYY